MPTLVCVPIAVDDEATALDDARAARDLGADLVEFRVDTFYERMLAEADDAIGRVLGLVRDCELPSILTCRPAGEGGEYHGHESDRIALLLRALADRDAPRYVDIELESFRQTPLLREQIMAMDRDARAGLIVSMHDFQGRPTDLTRRLASLHQLGVADVAKIAFRARSLRDNLELFEILEQRHGPTIALGMGEFGLLSRTLAPKFGGFLTFASLRDSSATAPGQPTINDLTGRFRFREITRSTAVYGVFGWPIKHSLSPAVHNAGFEAFGHDGVYLPLPIAAGESADDNYLSFKATLAAIIDARALNFRGASVTLPHKENLVRFAAERGWHIDKVAQACGAGNTLVRHTDDSWSVLNTDAAAAVNPLAEVLKGVHGRRIVVLGAGGVARAIVAELARRSAHVILCNRSPERAERLATDVQEAVGRQEGKALQIEVRELEWVEQADALVNCTPVGMSGGPAPGKSPITQEGLQRIVGLRLVQDTVYNPPETPLLKLATNAGLAVLSGVEMFVRQAAEQFRAWTGQPAPSALFQRIVREELRQRE